MRTVDALGELQQLRRPVLETGEVVARLGVSRVRASQILHSLEEAGLVSRLQRGLWLLKPEADPFSIAPYLTSPFPAYVSLWSALSKHGMIEQIPRQVFVVSLDRPRQVETPIATYSIHHFAAEVFGGFTGSSAVGYIATPEKALFDAVYLPSARRSTVYLPELELPEIFDESELATWAQRISAPWLRTKVSRELDELLAEAGEDGAKARKAPSS